MVRRCVPAVSSDVIAIQPIPLPRKGHARLQEEAEADQKRTQSTYGCLFGTTFHDAARINKRR
jgi:hypothetical protein